MAIQKQPRRGQVDWDGFVAHLEQLAWRMGCVYRGVVSYNALAKRLRVSPTTLSAINRRATSPGRDLCRRLAEVGGEDARVWLDLAGFLPEDTPRPEPDTDLDYALRLTAEAGGWTPRDMTAIVIGLGLSPEAALALKEVGLRHLEGMNR